MGKLPTRNPPSSGVPGEREEHDLPLAALCGGVCVAVGMAARGAHGGTSRDRAEPGYPHDNASHITAGSSNSGNDYDEEGWFASKRLA